MNLVGNAFKYTAYGHVEVGLELVPASQARALGVDFGEHVLLQVTDTGRGISREYLAHRLFTPFAQENNLSVGTGLGLSLVLQLTESLGGTIDVESELGAGTCVKVRIPVGDTLAQLSPDLPSQDPYERLRGRTLALVPWNILTSDAQDISGYVTDTTGGSKVVTDHLAATAHRWLGMNVSRDVHLVRASDFCAPTAEPLLRLVECEDRMDSYYNVYLYEEDRTVERSTVAAADHTTRRSDVTLSHPFGPQSLARALLRALEVVEDRHLSPNCGAPHALGSVAEDDDASMPPLPSNVSDGSTRTVTALSEAGDQTSATAIGLKQRSQEAERPSLSSLQILPSPRPPLDNPHPGPKNLLLVDDNDINLKLLVTCARKKNCVYQSASNGLEALEIYKATALLRPPSQPAFDLVIMDLSMPIMDGCVATREIRAFESSSDAPRAKIMALTALGSEVARERAWASGIDVFVTKPLSVKQLRDLCR
ncbi:hypothetical protein B0A55_09848 [Friedmanniomyces simplex]|uniref:histidine kinase n=1 Tax=Friedmanniomyces simplex TaxID=329884 RepID=A0A4U0WZA9_9PEZI|nr:hypothetical protein B0A55_09848 [Friedmanniomyces simplex]